MSLAVPGYTGEGIVELIMHMTCLATGRHLGERQISYDDKQTFTYLKAELQITWLILSYWPSTLTTDNFLKRATVPDRCLLDMRYVTA